MDELRKHGRLKTLEPNAKIDLHTLDTVWFLESGSVNLFAIDRQTGQRTLLTTASGPLTLFPFPRDETYTIVAITEMESQVWQVPYEKVDASAHTTPWLNALAQFYTDERLRKATHLIEESESRTLHPEETLAQVRGATHDERSHVQWIEVTQGRAHFLGHRELTLPQTPFPLTYTAWIQSAEPIGVTATPPPAQWKEGLHTFHTLLLSYIRWRKEKEKGQLQALASMRHEQEEQNVHSALQEMATVLTPLKRLTLNGSTEPLVRCCQEIGQHYNLLVPSPATLPETRDVAALLEAITEKSDLRYREVRLMPGWEKKDCGPLLVFDAKTEQPLVITRQKWGGYPIDPQTLYRYAYTFYPTFPDTLTKGREVIPFYLKRNKRALLPLLFYSFVAALLALFPPFATDLLVTRVIPEANYAMLGQISVGLVLAAVATSLFFLCRFLALARLEIHTVYQIQTALWDRVLKLPVSFFRQFTIGNLIQRVMAVERIRMLLSGAASRTVITGVFSLLYLVAMAAYAPHLALIATLTLLTTFILTAVCAFFYARKQKQMYAIEAKINAFLIQIVSSVGKLRVAGAENNAFSKWARHFADYNRTEIRALNIKNGVMTLNFLLPYLLYLGVFWSMYTEKTYSLGAFFAFNIAMIPLYIAMVNLNNTLMSLTPIVALWHRAKLFIHTPIEEHTQAQELDTLSGHIHVDEVSFSYDNESEPILNTLSLQAEPNAFIGIVGPSGCGKSTLLRLLLGFERPSRGAIYYDEKDLSSLNHRSLRKQIGVVLQDEGIITGSLLDNLTCGGTYTKEQIDRVLEISGLAEDVKSFPMGLYTHLSVGGSTLSGGQKQRVLIARALLPNPQILLLDEATSALDNRNQEHVIRSIDRLDVTRIVIAHRLSTVKNADRIYVMQEGRFVQSGTFEELSSTPGLFANMLERQKL